MCGHVGVFGNLNPKLVYAFECLLDLDVARGSDSTGVAYVNRKNEVTVVKDTVLPFRLMRDNKYIKQIMQKDNVCLIGHNRAATKGGVSVGNAHPHEIGDIVLAHNGTLHQQDLLPDHDKFSNDSRNLAHAVNKIGIEATWKLTNGAAVLVWWDRKEASLNFLGNGQRPFHFGLVKKGEAVVWSSDKDILEEGLRHADVELAGKDGEIYTLTNNERIVIQLTKKGGLVFRKAALAPWTYQSNFHQNNRRHVETQFDMDDARWEHYGENFRDKRDNLPAPSNAASRANDVPPRRHSVPNTRSGTGGASSPNGVPPRGNAKEKGLTEEQFFKDYPNCATCNDTMKFEFECALVVDSRSAVCGDCVKTAHANNIRL